MTGSKHIQPCEMQEPHKTARDWALHLADLGFLIFPLPAGSKKPMVKWTKVMTTDPIEINGWFDDTPKMNYGVCPGKNHVVIDLDDKDGQAGNLHFDMLESRNSEIATFSVRTPSGGSHLYLKVPHPVGNAHRFPEEMTDIDVRGARGYVVGPGSSFEGKFYEVKPYDSDIIADAPDWLLGYLKAPHQRDERAQEPLGEWDQPDKIALARKLLEECKPAIEGERGDHHTFATACRVKDYGVSEHKCLELMIASEWNDRCKPPWVPGELEQKVGNAYRYGSRRPGTCPGAMLDLAVEMGVIQIPSMNWDEVTGVNDNTNDLSQADTLWNKPAIPLDEITYRGSEFLKLKTRREMIAPNFLPAHGLTALLAKREAGKTVIMVDLALRLALDLDWDGLPLAKGWKVIYCVGEDDVGVQELMRAWCIHHGQEELPKERFIVMNDVPDLLSMDDTKAWAQHLRRKIGPDNKAIVFLDTWQRATAAAGQNEDKDMQRAVKNAEDIAAKLSGPIMIACHPPKAQPGTILGSSIIENVTSSIWEVKLNDKTEVRDLVVTRIKGSRKGRKRSYKFLEVELGEKDQFGLERDAVIAQLSGAMEQEAEEADQNRKAQAEAIRKVLEQQAQSSGEPFWMSKEALAKLLHSQTHGECTFPSLTQTKRDLEAAFNDSPYEFEDGAIFEMTKLAGRWRCEIKLPDLEISVDSVTGGEETTADTPTV